MTCYISFAEYIKSPKPLEKEEKLVYYTQKDVGTCSQALFDGDYRFYYELTDKVIRYVLVLPAEQGAWFFETDNLVKFKQYDMICPEKVEFSIHFCNELSKDSNVLEQMQKRMEVYCVDTSR